MLKVIVLIPCYNEEKNIDSVIKDLNDFREYQTDNNLSIDYIIINDCSSDETLAVCQKNNYHYMHLPVNLGIGGGVQTGYQYAFAGDYDIAIQHDGDGQHDPAFFKDVIAPLAADKADIVIGSRFINNQGFQSTGLRRLGISFLSILIHLCSGIKIFDVTSGYRAVNRKIIKYFARQYTQDYPEAESIVDAARHHARIMEVPVKMRVRKSGKSSINALQSIYYMIKVSCSILLHRAITPRKRGEING